MSFRKIEILKKDQFRHGSCVSLPIGSGPGMPVPSMTQPKDGGPAQVKIIESNSDYAILEIQCSCGQKSFVQCNYGNVAGT